jgi:hypothetical protein
MKNNLFLLLSAFIILAACNNSAGDKEKKEDTATATTHGDMHHPSTTDGAVPALPAVPDGAKIMFGNLKNEATVSSPFKIMMNVEGIKVDTAGPVVAGSGHHHLIIDGQDSIPAGGIIPKDSLNIHFGRGQTETEVALAPGKHKLTLQFADGLHRSYGSKLSATIQVNVKK